MAARLLRLTSVAAVLAGVLAATGTAASAADPLAARAGADREISSFLQAAAVPAVAAQPGGAAMQQPLAALASTAVASTAMAAKASSCTSLATQLAAKEISSYRCASVSAVTAAADGAGTAAVTWPSACSSGSGTVTGWLAVDRRHACDHEQFGITITQYSTNAPPKVIGTTNMHAVSTMSASTSMARWGNTKYLWVWGFTGVGFPTSTNGLLFGSCSGCLGTGGTWGRSGTTGDSWRGTGNVDVSGLTSGTSRSVGGFWEVTLSGNDWGNSVVVDLPIALSRCDNAIGGRVPGCVFSNIAGVVGFSQTTVPQFVRHVYGAQLSGLPGRLSTGTYLSRLTNSTNIARNGSRACPSSIPRPTGYQCDEYPFRSTHQGAYTSGATVARSQSWCRMPDPARTGSTGWSRCFILGTQNASAGGTLGGFYANERMLDGDKFQVGYLS